MRKYLLQFSLLLLFSFILVSCDDSSTDPDPVGDVGSLKIESTPTGATIFIDNVNQGLTNKTVTNVAVGNRNIRLELDGYRDTSFTVIVEKGLETFKQVGLTEVAASVTSFGPVRIYETTGTTASQPSGLDLSSGQALSVSNNNIDLFYFTNSTFTVHELRSADRSSGLTRETDFWIGSGTNIEDGDDSPLVTNAWVDFISDGENNYFFAYDNDGHYSKVKIVSISPTNEIPAWVELEWLYNETVDDQRF